jgi:hypothetical protein
MIKERFSSKVVVVAIVRTTIVGLIKWMIRINENRHTLYVQNLSLLGTLIYAI